MELIEQVIVRIASTQWNIETLLKIVMYVLDVNGLKRRRIGHHNHKIGLHLAKNVVDTMECTKVAVVSAWVGSDQYHNGVRVE